MWTWTTEEGPSPRSRPAISSTLRRSARRPRPSAIWSRWSRPASPADRDNRSQPMDIVLVECPGDRRVLLCGRSLVFAEGPDSRHPQYDAEWMAEQLARAAGVGVHRVDLPAGFH